MSVPYSSVWERMDNIWWQIFFSRRLRLLWGTDVWVCRAAIGRVLVAFLCGFNPTLLLSHYRWSANRLRSLPLPVPWHGPSHSSHTAQGHPGAQKRGQSWWSSSWWDKTMAQWKCPPCKWVSRGNIPSGSAGGELFPSLPQGRATVLFGDPQKESCCVVFSGVCSVQL